MNLGYIILFVLYAAIALFPFILGFLEYKKPADPGPLYINLDTIVSDRKDALTFREIIEQDPEIRAHLSADEISACFDTSRLKPKIDLIFSRIFES